MHNEQERKAQEQNDIEGLMSCYGRQLDWVRIQEYYDMFDLFDGAKKLRERFDRAE